MKRKEGGCRQALKGYQTTVEEDLRLLPGLDPGSPLDLAVRVRTFRSHLFQRLLSDVLSLFGPL